MSLILKAENISFSFTGKREDNILTDISLEIQKNSICGLIGESGAGKTTLAKILAGLEKPASGKITRTKENKTLLLFQNSEELLHPSRKIIDILKDVSPSMEEIEDTCRLLNFNTSLLSQKGITLSGGERQRAALARILLKKPELIIMDEPFSAQDPDSTLNLTSLFKEINRTHQISFFIISHNLTPFRGLAQNIYVMLNGKIVESGEAYAIFENPAHSYTSFLLKAENYSMSREAILEERNAVGII